jgi:hypothetical protein
VSECRGGASLAKIAPNVQTAYRAI